jgi:phosphoglucosamine mutase
VVTNVGDRNVCEEMKRGGYNIGGEDSGHVILTDYTTTGDGLLVAAKFLRLLKESGKPLSELVSGIKNYPQKLIGVKITPEARGTWDKNADICRVIAEAEAFFGGDGRVLVRPSGTEPLLRIMIEGKVESEVDEWLEKIKEAVERAL